MGACLSLYYFIVALCLVPSSNKMNSPVNMKNKNNIKDYGNNTEMKNII